jgi:hypothetical protein
MRWPNNSFVVVKRPNVCTADSNPAHGLFFCGLHCSYIECCWLVLSHRVCHRHGGSSNGNSALLISNPTKGLLRHFHPLSSLTIFLRSVRFPVLHLRTGHLPRAFGTQILDKFICSVSYISSRGARYPYNHRLIWKLFYYTGCFKTCVTNFSWVFPTPT